MKGTQKMKAILEGKITSIKAKDTVTVEVVRMFKHPLYQKRIRRYSKFLAHYEGNELKVGETVKIIETRPISKNKHFKVMTKEESTKKTIKEEEKVVEKKVLKTKTKK